MKSQSEVSIGDGSSNPPDGPLIIKDRPIDKGPSPVRKTVILPKPITDSNPKQLTVMNSEVPVSSVKEVKKFYKPTLKPRLGYHKPTIRSKFPPPKKTVEN